MFRFELLQFFPELSDLMNVIQSVIDDLVNLVLIAA